MVTGMDSSRSGPLSTLILMLPLIVVPALVVLRPPDRSVGVSGSDLTAAADSDEFAGEAGDFDTMFTDVVSPEGSLARNRSTDPGFLISPRSGSAEGGSNMIRQDDPTWSSDVPADPSTAPQSRPGSRTSPDLSHWGVTRSVWFAPGAAGRVGFAAFVPARDDSVQYRFAAIGDSDRQVIRDVVLQIERWQSAEAAGSNLRAN